MPANAALWAYVIVTPEDNKRTVFNNGKLHGSISCKPLGGHTEPISIDIDNVQWKNAQKKEKKNIISDKMNKTIPNEIPKRTLKVWCPWYVDSTITS
jgi:hypothetical protein